MQHTVHIEHAEDSMKVETEEMASNSKRRLPKNMPVLHRLE
jgi:hypothetical protein